MKGRDDVEGNRKIAEKNIKDSKYRSEFKWGRYDPSVKRVADELSDILFIVIRIADYYGIDLEKEHMRQLDIAIEHPLMKVK